MKQLSKMTKKELDKLTQEQIKQKAIQEMQEIVNKNSILTDVKLDADFIVKLTKEYNDY